MPVLKNRKHEKFAQAIAMGHTAYHAYRKHISRGGTRATSDQGASKMCKSPKISTRIEELRQISDKKVQESAVFELSHAMLFLRDVINTPVGEVNETSPLCQEVSYSDQGAKKTKMPDKLRALELLAKLAPNSWFSPEKHEMDGKLEIIITKQR